MKYGVFLPSFGRYGDPELIINTAVEMEDAGWDGIFLPDHLFHDQVNGFLDPLLLLSAIATRTEKIRLGTWIIPIPRRQPWQLARDLARLDILSKGRVILGAGLGSPPTDFTKIGIDYYPKQLANRMDEALDIITKFWSGETFSHEGEFYSLDEVNLGIVPIQRPRIPIWLAARWPSKKPIRRGAEWDGIMPITNRFPEQFTEAEMREMVAYYRLQLQSQNKSDGDILVSWDHLGNYDQEEFRQLAQEVGVTWLMDGLHPLKGDLQGQLNHLREGPP